MSEPELDQKKKPRLLPPFWRRMLTPLWVVIRRICVLVIIFMVMVLAATLDPMILTAVVHLVVGWFLFIWRELPLVQVNPSLAFSLLMSLGVAMWLLHRAVSGLCLRSGAKPKWAIRHTLAVTTLILVLFGAAIVGTGVGHQVALLKRDPMTSDSVEDGRRFSTAVNLCTLLSVWAEDHDGRYPLSLQQLVPSLMDEEDAIKSFSWSAALGGEAEPLVYLGGFLTTGDPDNLPLIVSPRPSASGEYLLARKDMSARPVSPEVYQQAMADWRAHLAGLSLTK